MKKGFLLMLMMGAAVACSTLTPTEKEALAKRVNPLEGTWQELDVRMVAGGEERFSVFVSALYGQGIQRALRRGKGAEFRCSYQELSRRAMAEESAQD